MLREQNNCAYTVRHGFVELSVLRLKHVVNDVGEPRRRDILQMWFSSKTSIKAYGP